jgi:hypothetical protein
MPNVLLTQHSSGAGQRKTPIKSRYFKQSSKIRK